jgi:hypothetical protein
MNSLHQSQEIKRVQPKRCAKINACFNGPYVGIRGE